ncbi:unnamed protein product [Clonostachys rosea f. rosea IK726]|jgi:hypothetical protein|uniref:EF-hand domain-containing protein n=2 Tax=Bionectria ochroleuca TaxID=29856 RepID=A0A8H7NHS3_BIOOC|nr:unnamed protein product [Clonostachys rosea f. rosea IK726]
MVAINNIALPTAVVLGLVSQALALPVQATQDIVDSGLLERAIEAEIQERDLEERFSFKKAVKGVANVGKSLLGFRDVADLDEREIEELVQRYYEDEELDTRDLEERKFSIGKIFKGVAKTAGKILFRDLAERDLEEMSERDIDDLVARYIDDSELDTRDLEERKFSIGKIFKGVAKTAGKILFRDLAERDLEEMSERDIDELVARYAEDAELDARDYEEELDERDLEERFFLTKAIGKVAKTAGKLLFRDLAERDIDEMSERDVDDLVARYFDEEDLEIRDFDDELEERDLEERKFSIGKIFKGVAKTAGKILFRDLAERDLDELSERDIEEIFTRYAEDADLEAREFDEEMEERDFDEEMEERDIDELDERDLEERFFLTKAIGKVAKTAGKLLFRDLSERDVDSLDERDIEELVTRAFDESSELETRDFDDMIDERDLEERKFSIGKIFKGVAKTAGKILFRDLGEEELSERDIEDIVTRAFEEYDDLE